MKSSRAPNRHTAAQPRASTSSLTNSSTQSRNEIAREEKDREDIARQQVGIRWKRSHARLSIIMKQVNEKDLAERILVLETLRRTYEGIPLGSNKHKEGTYNSGPQQVLGLIPGISTNSLALDTLILRGGWEEICKLVVWIVEAKRRGSPRECTNNNRNRNNHPW